MKATIEGATLKVRSDLHIARRLFHCIGVGVIIIFYRMLPRQDMILLFSAFTFVCLTVDVLRLKSRTVNQKLLAFFGSFIRKNEIIGLTGMSYLSLGVTIVALIFPADVVTLCLLMLAVGDPVSSIFGIIYGKDVLINKKTLQGTLAGFIACLVVSFMYFSLAGLMQERSVLAALLAGLIGAVSELTPVFGLDDNFTFPIMSACLLWIQFQIM